MLTFAAPTASGKAGGVELSVASALPGRGPQDGRDRLDAPGGQYIAGEARAAAHWPSPAGCQASESKIHYWPCDLLNAFVLQMAATGHCVNTAMMLGHRPYALEQLATARAEQGEELHTLAAQLQAYFDAAPPQACAVVAELEGD